ncbi:MAG: hypothetical protein LBK83_04185 [Treponema sp.]|jgi:hypothetical protein|nr:hypothetical protein [Treponema sp.]
MAKVRKKHERGRWDDLADKIRFKGLTQGAVLGQDGSLDQVQNKFLEGAVNLGACGCFSRSPVDWSGVFRFFPRLQTAG